MKKLYALVASLLFASASSAQICNPTGNLILFSNYDGGVLNINLNAPMGPGIKIGVCTYEGVTINISGIGASSVSAVAYAGFNANNAHCGSIINTSITGTPGTSVNTITFAPPATLSNPNGNGSIICATSCNTTSSAGGCNTLDQVEDYFLTFFPGSTIFSHTVQYGCWSGTQNVASGGTCCLLATGVTTINIESFNIFPNPAENVLNITALNNFKGASFRLFSVEGKLLRDKAQLSETVDISALESGIYFIEFSDGTYVTRNKFVKQ